MGTAPDDAATDPGARIREAIVDGDRGLVLAALAGDVRGIVTPAPGQVSILLLALYHGRPRLAEDIALAMADGGVKLDVLEAAALGDQPRLAAIVDHDPNEVTRTTPDGFTPLHLAAFLGRPDATRLLLRSGADVEAVAANDSAVRPLHSGVAGGQPDVVEALLRAGADVDAPQRGGFTPLMGAAAQGSVAVVEGLLVAGARRSVVDEDGRTAAEHAEAGGHDGLADLLRTG